MRTQGFNGEFSGNSSIEAASTFRCVAGTKSDGVACSWPGNNETVHLGKPLPDAVWRSNHVTPTHTSPLACLTFPRHPR